MSKDPAFLFYPNDWLGGTMTLTRHQKGCYIDLLVAQFNSGPLSLDTIKTILGQDQAAWTVLSSKFKQTAERLWYNERLVAEKAKREEFSNKQKERVNKRWYPSGIVSGNTVVLPVENRNTNENGNRNVFEDRGVGKETFSIEDCLTIAMRDARWIKANGTEREEVVFFNQYLERQGIYEFNPGDYKKYFAKLKGKYPELLKPTAKKLSIEDYRRIARELDAQMKAV